MNDVDVVIIGGGLAGCSLAWQCRLRGLCALMIDAPRKDSSSRVAAGLVTPITGSRHAVSWRWHEFFSMADAFYRRLEAITGQVFWHVAPAWRAFDSPQEAESWALRWSGHASNGLSIHDLSGEDQLRAWFPWGGIQMEPAARLDAPMYLDATRESFERDGSWIQAVLDADHELIPEDDAFRIPRFGIKARWIVLCQGYWARTNRWFDSLPLHPARGDILEIACPRIRLDHVLHRNGWIVPLTHDRYLLGATYDRHGLDTSPAHPIADQWRRELCRRWTLMTGGSMESLEAKILSHRIAVRPASYDRHPLMGSHPQHQNLLCLNGLGSKGSLMAPFLSKQLLDWMLYETPVEATLIWNRRSHS
ncbi:MAG: FAD-binding oxidoreductase [Pirellula sp.]|nr:FAD-binding oxidoreductase [Pirellula sp.]